MCQTELRRITHSFAEQQDKLHLTMQSLQYSYWFGWPLQEDKNSLQYLLTWWQESLKKLGANEKERNSWENSQWRYEWRLFWDRLLLFHSIHQNNISLFCSESDWLNYLLLVKNLFLQNQCQFYLSTLTKNAGVFWCQVKNARNVLIRRANTKKWNSVVQWFQSCICLRIFDAWWHIFYKMLLNSSASYLYLFWSD